MNVVDLPGLAAIRPSDVQQFLRSRGWELAEERSHGVLVYTRELNGHGEIPLELPTNTRLPDYAKRLGEAVEILAAVEKTPLPHLVDELSIPPADIVQFRLQSDLVGSGTIPVDDGIRIRQAQKNLLLAAAHSVLEPRPHFPRMSQAKPMELLGHCREGQTARGSYLTRILVPVEPGVGKLPLEDPFGRQVTRMLGRALAEAHELAHRGDFEALVERAQCGLSANFLRALAELQPQGERSSLEVGVRWSRARRPPGDAMGPVRFEEGVFPAFSSAATALREQTPSPHYELEGYVQRLDREPPDDAARPGTVVLVTTLEDRPGTSKVWVELSPDHYQKAVDAHREARQVRLVGTLQRERRRYWLREATGLEVLPAEDDEA
ncbi:MAG: hypothetical protein ACQEXJ_06070 [Myxococcota bacterium]